MEDEADFPLEDWVEDCPPEKLLRWLEFFVAAGLSGRGKWCATSLRRSSILRASSSKGRKSVKTEPIRELEMLGFNVTRNFSIRSSTGVLAFCHSLKIR